MRTPLNLGEADASPDSRQGFAAEPPSWIEQAGAVAVLAGAVIGGFFAIRLLGGYVALLRLLWRSETAPPEVRGLFETMAAGTRWVRLLVSRRLLVPLSCGLVRPTVVLPASMCQPPTPRQLRWIFAHELTHLRRRDAWSASCSTWVKSSSLACRGSGGCGARCGSARNLSPTRPPPSKTREASNTPSSC